MGKRKLNAQQIAHIKKLHTHGVTANSLARMYGVTWGTIQFILHPEKAELNRERMKLRQRQLRSKSNLDGDK